MPRAQRVLSDVFEENTTTKQIRCKICMKAAHDGLGSWMRRSSADKHIGSDRHKELARAAAEEAERNRQDQARLEKLNRAPVRAPRSLLDLIHVSRPKMFQQGSSKDSQAPLSSRTIPDTSASSQPRDMDFYDFQELVESSQGFEPIIPTYMTPISDNSVEKHQHLQEQFNMLLRQAEHNDEFGMDDDSEDDAALEDELQDLVQDDIDDPEEIAKYFSSISANKDYSPYPNKLLMLLDILDNLPRLRLSGNLFKMVLWILKEVGVHDVPSYDAFRKMQTELRDVCGSKPELSQSTLGNIFYVNNIQESVARDFANPEVAKHLHFYPEETYGPISEVWQASRWKEFKPSELTPMYSHGYRQFYIEEISQLQNGQFVIPHDWVVRKKELTARCSIVVIEPNGWRLEASNKIVSATSFRYNYHDIIDRVGNVKWKAGTVVPVMPNKLRKIAGDKELYVIMVPLWCDDVSGNRSKQYNKHINMYMVNSNLPGKLLQQEYFVRFVSASPHATAPEQFSTLKDQINSTHTKPIQCFNAATRRECSVMLRVPGLPADNPQQSEEASHIGGGGNCKCRKCRVGGNAEHTESDEGYHSLHFSGVLRDADETRGCLARQLELAGYGVEKPITELQTATGTKDKIAQYWIDIILQKSREMKNANPSRDAKSIAEELQGWLRTQPGDKMNPLLYIEGLDPTQDTPVEILHTILLGVMKYVWHTVNLSWTDAERAAFAIRLQSTDLKGRTVPPLRATYIVQYRNNLIGKHFKTLMQTLAFAVHGLVTSKELKLIEAVGALGALLWVHEIEDMEEYLDDLDILVGNVLDAFDEVMPKKIVDKLKLHILVHLREDIRRFGPAIRYSTEVFECFNAIFRLCSVFSNHQAPSRDISTKFTSMDRIKHILSGGFWKKDGEWVQAGRSVRRVLHDVPIIQRHFGWVPQTAVVPGSVRPKGKKKTPPCEWVDTLASKYATAIPLVEREGSWRFCVSAVAQSGDHCTTGSWIFFQHNLQPGFGRIEEIITIDNGTNISGYVTLENFVLGKDQHEAYHLPFLRRPQPDEASPRQVIRTHDIKFQFSAQHDCRTAKCEPTGNRPETQERRATNRIEKLIKHTEDNIFIVNMYGLHNAMLLRKALGRDLVRPKPLHNDRKAFHVGLAAELRISQQQKRAATQEKRKSTMASRRAEKRKRDQAMEEEVEEEAEEQDGEENPEKRMRI